MRRFLVLLAALLVASCACAPAYAGTMGLMHLGKPPGGGGGAPTPVFAWATQGNASNGSASATTSKASNTINVGDLLVAVLALTDNSGTNHFVVCPTGFTAAFSTSYDGNTNHTECWKIAAGGDTGGAFQFTWTTNISQIGQWTLMDFTGANASTPNDASANGQNTAIGPSVTTTGANRLLISCSSMAGSSVTVSSQPSGMTNLFTGSSGANIRTQCASVSMPSAAASGTKTWSWSAGNPVQTFNTAIAP